MRKGPDERELRLLEREPEIVSEPRGAEEIDAAESRWDPWLRALAQLEAWSDAHVN